MWVEKLSPGHRQTQAVKRRLSAPNQMAAKDVGVQLQGPRISARCAHILETSRYWQGAVSDPKLREIPLQRAAVPWVEWQAGEQAVSQRWTPAPLRHAACALIKASSPYSGSGLSHIWRWPLRIYLKVKLECFDCAVFLNYDVLSVFS